MKTVNGKEMPLLKSMGIKPLPPKKGHTGECPLCGGKNHMACSEANGEWYFYCSTCGSGNLLMFVSRYYEENPEMAFNNIMMHYLGGLSDKLADYFESEEYDELYSQEHFDYQANRILNIAVPASQHPYLAKRGLEWDDINVTDKDYRLMKGLDVPKGSLILPMSTGSCLYALDFITPEGESFSFNNGLGEDEHFVLRANDNAEAIVVAPDLPNALILNEVFHGTIIVTSQQANLTMIRDLLAHSHPNVKCYFIAEYGSYGMMANDNDFDFESALYPGDLILHPPFAPEHLHALSNDTASFHLDWFTFSQVASDWQEQFLRTIERESSAPTQLVNAWLKTGGEYE
ncbi:hypothetical protein FE810_15395 [Thalassotalea litorea]|uniref:Uncharacterized protein n=1 Tax=Thalassotalea litorea TaxID=2020715 RepID=A0A5R9IC82_9GAMM|nr:hypothetical protein [Thalassotalea litorea]TLU61206.1 hypothetical protein FE810_15395 [Thalassotalea litorea]